MKMTTLLLSLTTLGCNLIVARHACLWAALGLLATLASVGLPARAAVTEAWVQRYSNVVSNSNDQAVKVVRDAAANVIVTGFTDDGITGRDMLTIKYSGADGSVLWQQRYNGPANMQDYAMAVAVDGSGNVLVTGSSQGDCYTAKYAAANGALLWEKRGPGGGAAAVAVDGSGNVIVTGTDGGYYMAKYAAADGALLWEKRGPAGGAYSVAVDGSGNVVVTGSSQGNGSDDYYTAKYAAADGVLLWEQRYNGPVNSVDQSKAVAVDGSGNVVVTGVSYTGTSQGGYFGDYYTAKYAATNGALLWEKRYNGPAHYGDQANAVAVDGSGNVVVTGSSDGSGSSRDYYTAKYAAADGALLWEKHSNGGGQALAVDSNGNVVVTGSSALDAISADCYTAKYAAADGALLWEKGYNGLSKSYNEARAVVVDGSGNLVVTGFSEGNGGGGDHYTAKYAAADGALLWEKRSNGLENYFNVWQALAVDGSGNVVVTGASGNGTNPDYYTAKYAAADRALLWEQRYTNANGNASAVAVDGSGNVVVTGFSGNGTNDDYYTAKYAAADGALLWEKRYNGPANSYDSAKAVAVEGSGNVVVTGITDAISLCYECGWVGDYYTAKYAAADGALLWEKRYNGGEARAVAVDASGNVVVTGSSATVKYAAADGAVLWEKRYSGGSLSLALGPNGMVAVIGSATVVYWENLPPVSIARVPTGIRLRFTGIPGRSYTIERARTVTGPWTPINTQTAPASGLLEYNDTTPSPGSAFYRTVQP